MKLATEKRADIERQVARSAIIVKDALRRLNDSSRCVELLEEGPQGQKSELREMVKAHDLATAK